MMRILLIVLILYFSIIKCFEEMFIEISFNEEQENDTLVIDLRSKIESLSLLNNSKVYEMKFVRPCLNFYIDKRNKFEIRSLKIDREFICPYEINCSFYCYLFIEKEEMKLIKLKINIKDINDHQPKFNKKYYLYEIINENLIENVYHIELEEAKDKDLSLENSIKNYYLNISKEMKFPFKLNYQKENHLLELILINSIKEKSYLIELIVIDGQNLKDNCLIEIKILENDFSFPKFDLNLYQFYIFNSNETFIGKVNAQNSLNNSNKEIFYRLIPSSSLMTNIYLFQINSKTGEIYFKNNQNHFLNHFYELFIEGFYLNSISSLTTVQIYFNFTSSLLSQNDFIQIFIPKFFQKDFNNKNQIYLKENSSIPLTILQIFLSSTSSSSTLEMKTSIDENSFYLKELDQQSYELILLKSIDYEFIKNISLDFILNEQNFSRKSIEIIIENINDCPPLLKQSHFFLEIQENNLSPFLLYTFEYEDKDYLNNIIYQIQTIDLDDNQIFFINSTNGQLWILKSLDREFKSNYSFFICVFDQIYQTCSSIYLQILDENDQICQFNSSILTLTIQENLLSNINLIQIQAFDHDYQQNGTIFYSLSPLTSYLYINSTNGLIQTTINSFNYQLIQQYSILIIGCDNIYSFPSFCCSLQLNISILNLNDYLPYLIYPSSINQVFIINYINKTMPSLKANDYNLDQYNHFISFLIIGGSLKSSLSIDYYSGQLSLLSSILPIYGTLIISISSQTIIQLTILIHDNQTNPQTFLMSIQQSSSSSQFFSIILITVLLLLLLLFLLFYFLKFKSKKNNNDDDRLMHTPSTTTLSARSLSTSHHKKIYDTYYSFGDTLLSPQVIQL